MDKKTISQWIMYHQIQKMLVEGSTFTEVASYLGLDRRTVKKYAGMNQQEYEEFLLGKDNRRKLLAPYESFVKDKLQGLPSASSAQIHDWLKEHHPDFAPTSPRTVYNFVMWVRQKYQIVVEEKVRDYFRVEELPYGAQAQADFGQYILRSNEGRKKVYFFSMVLSASRYKYVYFSERPFTTKTAILAHEAAFEFFKGLPKEIVYDQDRLFLVDENLGNLLLTKDFKEYIFERDYQPYFCRKSDPESKGKIENVIGYIKKNFLYGRLYHDLDILQREALAWLERTGNAMVHGTTGKVPVEEWRLERAHLQSWAPIGLMPDYITGMVLKDNMFNYQGNTYSLPQGTYSAKGRSVKLRLDENGLLSVYDQDEQLLCKHQIPHGRGNTIINTDHKRDKSSSIRELMDQIAGLFEDQQQARLFLQKVRDQKPRYVRDQLLSIRDSASVHNKPALAEALKECTDRELFDAIAFREVLRQTKAGTEVSELEAVIKPLDPANLKKAETRPASSDIGVYERLFKNQINH